MKISVTQTYISNFKNAWEQFKTQASHTKGYAFTRICLQIMFICFIYYAGVYLSWFMNYVVPGNILGMLLLMVLLISGLLHERFVQHGCKFLLNYMAIFFLPAGVGVIKSFGVLQDKYLAFVLICIITTLLVFVATTVSVQATTWLLNRRKQVIKEG